ncbi:MAG: HAD-IA family hydrolase, partial [Endomicrobia bacterium]|nr:HAD-IA family hydrolase [Endomicrobiia bacterium]
VVNYKVNSWLVDYVSKNNKKYFIISNNLSSTIAYVLNEIGISNRFKSIIGIDRVSLSKPNPEAFDIIKNMLVSSKTVFIGDTEKDRIFAQNCNITFIFVGGWL